MKSCFATSGCSSAADTAENTATTGQTEMSLQPIFHGYVIVTGHDGKGGQGR